MRNFDLTRDFSTKKFIKNKIEICHWIWDSIFHHSNWFMGMTISSIDRWWLNLLVQIFNSVIDTFHKAFWVTILFVYIFLPTEIDKRKKYRTKLVVRSLREPLKHKKLYDVQIWCCLSSVWQAIDWIFNGGRIAYFFRLHCNSIRHAIK